MCHPEENKTCKVSRKQNLVKRWVDLKVCRCLFFSLDFSCSLVQLSSEHLVPLPGASKEGHVMTCQIV